MPRSGYLPYRKTLCIVIAVIATGIVFFFLDKRRGRHKVIETLDDDDDTDNTYDYASQIKTPDQIGSSPSGSWTALGKNVKAFVGYIDVLVSGDSKAQKTSGAMGNKYFMKTAATCTDSNGDDQTRYVYIDNVPTGAIPLFTGSMGTTTTQFKGLVPGIMEGVTELNPTSIITSLTDTDNSCAEVNLETISTDNVHSTESQYIIARDVESINPCNFADGVNPETKNKCSEKLSMRPKAKNGNEPEKQIPDDPAVRLYFLALGFLGAYIAYRCIVKKPRRS